MILLIENLNCDYTDVNDLQSLELALQLQAEEFAQIKVQDTDGYTIEEIKVKIIIPQEIPVKNYKIKEEAEQCPLCNIDFKQDDNVIELKCNHAFHQQCAEEWLSYHFECSECGEVAIPDIDP